MIRWHFSFPSLSTHYQTSMNNCKLIGFPANFFLNDRFIWSLCYSMLIYIVISVQFNQYILIDVELHHLQEYICHLLHFYLKSFRGAWYKNTTWSNLSKRRLYMNCCSKIYNLFQDYIKDNHQRPPIRSFSPPKKLQFCF